MLSFYSLSLWICIERASALAITATPIPTPEIVHIVKREAIPTFRFGPKEHYAPSQVSICGHDQIALL